VKKKSVVALGALVFFALIMELLASDKKLVDF